MNIKKKAMKSLPVAFLEGLAGGPLSLGRLLAAIRLGEDMTQASLAKRLGVSKAHLCDIEKDRRSVSPARASQWAKTLGYDPEQFIELALQGELFKCGLSYTVTVKPIRTAS